MSYRLGPEVVGLPAPRVLRGAGVSEMELLRSDDLDYRHGEGEHGVLLASNVEVGHVAEWSPQSPENRRCPKPCCH